MKRKAKQASLDHTALVELLKIDARHNKRIDALEAQGLDLHPLRVELLDIVLDALGVPPDNTSEQFDKYGAFGACNLPSTFCRDFILEQWQTVSQGSDSEIAQFPNWVLEEIQKASNSTQRQ